MRVFYSTFQFIGDIQRFIESSDRRLVAADVLAKAFIPAFVTLRIEMTGYTISDEEMRRSLESFINNQNTELRLNEFIAEATRLGATEVESDPTATVDLHGIDGTITTTSLSVGGTDSITLADNERFVARAVNVIRT